MTNYLPPSPQSRSISPQAQNGGTRIPATSCSGLLAAAITGRFYGDLLREWIFAPLDMTTARVITEEEIASPIARPATGWKANSFSIRNTCRRP